MGKKVVLAFSGGLDTSFCTAVLKEQGYSVVTVFVDTAGFDKKKLVGIEKKAYSLGASKHYTIFAEKELYNKNISYLIKANGFYQNIYPQMCIDRYVIVGKCIEIAKKEKANIVAHGCTAMGNDQVRFDVSIRALSNYEIIAPIRELSGKNIRKYEIDYLTKKGFDVPLKHKKYSINQNILGVTISGSEIDANKEPLETAFVLTKPVKSNSKPTYIKIGFKEGVPVSINNKKMDGVSILKKLNKVVGEHGCGRFIYTGDCIIGIKGRIAFECPGISALVASHKALEEAVLSKEQNQFKEIISQKWAFLVYSGLYFDPLRKDVEKFIDSHQKYVTGEVVLKLYKAVITPVKYSSRYILKEKNTVYAQNASWNSKEAESFIKLFGMGTVLSKK